MQNKKPVLVFFQWDHTPNLKGSTYLLTHMQAHVKCLTQHFDVKLINADCDFSQICDLYEPDLALFEAGYRSHGSRRIAIRNTSANRFIPRLALHNGDAWCDRRAGLLSDMDDWEIETLFSICSMMPAYTTSIADRTFIWPNFIDHEKYRDYGNEKTVSVMLTGQVNNLYPWRQKVFPILRAHYPCLASPAAPYGTPEAKEQLVGERYAQALNGSFVVPTCGTIAGEVVRKHFEIPGSMSCLVTEKSPGLEAAGFKDMINCVFADPQEVLDKLNYLFANPDELHCITEAGYKLVHSRHTLADRPQIYQWLMLNKIQGPNDVIVQRGPFADLELVDRACGINSEHLPAVGLDRILIKKGDALAATGQFEMAGQLYHECLKYIPYLPEAKFRLALLALSEGEAARAKQSLVDLIEVSLHSYGARHPDPAEWSYYLTALICNGYLSKARTLVKFYPELRSIELGYIRAILGSPEGEASKGPSGSHLSESIHVLPTRDFGEWAAWLSSTLAACGQKEIVNYLNLGKNGRINRPNCSKFACFFDESYLCSKLDRFVKFLGFKWLIPNVPPSTEFRYLSRMVVRSVGRGRLRQALLWLRDRFRDLVRMNSSLRQTDA